MNIGIVTTWFERGAAYVSRQYMDSLAREHQVFIYARAGEAYAKGDPVWDRDYVTWGRRLNIPISTVMDKKDFQRWISANRIDAVLFNEQQWWRPVLWASEAGALTGAYVDYYTEETIPLFAAYDFLLCNTRRHYSAFDWHPQAMYIPWGADLELFAPRSLEPVEPGRTVFFHSAGMNPERKGTDLVIRAFDQVKGDSKLVIHSQRELKKFFPKLKDLIAGLEKQGRLVCHEETVTAPGLYHLGDVYVYPSRLEGIGLTMAEALACGLPLVTVDFPPMNEFVEPPVSRTVKIARTFARADGYYWPQCIADLGNLTDAMNYYAARPESIGKLKKAARKYAEKNLDWMKNTAEMVKSIPDYKKLSQDQKREAAGKILHSTHHGMGLAEKASQKNTFLLKLPNWVWKILKAFFKS
ncbi:MAG: glycosyltransferase family 4 protein [Brevinematales bacterium]|nr:glycosyltransferase family 4 protein [Brevinematales bacterium]